MTASQGAHPWSKDALLNKAKLYIERMETASSDDDRFGLWSALGLELVARAALAHQSPALIADSKDWRNVAYAIGLQPAATKFSPKSATTKEVLQALAELVPEFTQEMAGFCTQHATRRNAELHTGDTVFGGAGSAKWLPRFYEVCSVLLKSMQKDPADFFEDGSAVVAIIATLHDEEAKKVKGSIDAYKTVWEEKSDEDRTAAEAQATTWATRNQGHRAVCPACRCMGLVQGTAHGPAKASLEDGEVIERQRMVPSTFHCIACGLHVQGYSKLSASGLGDLFTATTRYTAAEYYGLYTEDDLEEARNEYPPEEPDFNDY